MPSSNNFELRSDEVQEILSHVPHWLIRWGITTIFFVIFALLVASWFVKYPDVVSARVMLTTEVPPVHLVAGASGRIDLVSEDKQNVSSGEILAIIENSADTQDVLQLISQIEELKSVIYKKPVNPASIQINSSLNLGGLQQPYLAFISQVEELERFKSISIYENQKASLLDRISYYQRLSKRIKRQLELITEEVAISKQIYEDDSVLYKQGAGIKTEKNRSKANYLLNERNKESLESTLVQNNIQIAQLKAQVSELDLQEKETNDKLFASLIESFETLESQVQAWKQSYLIQSPIDGKLSFSKFWSDNQYVSQQEVVMTVIPQSDGLVGQVTMPIQGSGKVEVGQKVNIKLDNYPYNEYGMVLGQVESISLVPRDNSYQLRISLPNDLKSTYNKDLAFKQEMQGSAEIITENKRLIERVFNQLRNILSKV